MADLQSAADSPQTLSLLQVTTPDPICVADCVALLRQEKPELAAVVEAWETLPAAIQAAIVAMVETAQR